MPTATLVRPLPDDHGTFTHYNGGTHGLYRLDRPITFHNPFLGDDDARTDVEPEGRTIHVIVRSNPSRLPDTFGDDARGAVFPLYVERVANLACDRGPLSAPESALYLGTIHRSLTPGAATDDPRALLALLGFRLVD